MKIHRKANILVLAGVFISDFDEPEPEPVEPESTYSEIPKKFTSVANWPKSTNLLCWSCSLVPPGAPMFIPQNPEFVCGEEMCDCLGNFCNSGCAAAYIYTNIPTVQHWDLFELLKRFEAKFTGFTRVTIPRGPPKTEMKAYCGAGGLTVKQWRDKADMQARDYAFTLRNDFRG